MHGGVHSFLANPAFAFRVNLVHGRRAMLLLSWGQIQGQFLGMLINIEHVCVLDGDVHLSRYYATRKGNSFCKLPRYECIRSLSQHNLVLICGFCAILTTASPARLFRPLTSDTSSFALAEEEEAISIRKELNTASHNLLARFFCSPRPPTTYLSPATEQACDPSYWPCLRNALHR